MDVFSFIFVGLVLTDSFKCTRSMGLCDFEEKFPCEENEGSICHKRPGCKKHTPRKTLTGNHSSYKQFLDNRSTPDVVSTEGHPIGYSTTTLRVITTNLSCPPNMVFAICTTCQGTCMDPKGCIKNCTEPELCVCPDGFLFKGDVCVPHMECECFVEGVGVIPNGEIFINEDCTRSCICIDNQLSCDENYKCSTDATCTAKDRIRKCYCNDDYEGDGETCIRTRFRDCYDVYQAGHTTDGTYTILPTDWPELPFEVFCNMTFGDGGWTVFQRRIDGVTDFYRNWEEYKRGFGKLDEGNDFWLGNEKLQYLTNQRDYILRVDLVHSSNQLYYEEYTTFKIGDESTKYQLSYVSGNDRNTDNYRLEYNNGGQFSTYDQDNDGCNDHDCAEGHKGGWWYVDYWCTTCYPSHCLYFQASSNCHTLCTASNLNGRFYGVNGENLFYWTTSARDCNHMFAEMKLRPTSH